MEVLTVRLVWQLDPDFFCCVRQSLKKTFVLLWFDVWHIVCVNPGVSIRAACRSSCFTPSFTTVYYKTTKIVDSGTMELWTLVFDPGGASVSSASPLSFWAENIVLEKSTVCTLTWPRFSGLLCMTERSNCFHPGVTSSSTKCLSLAQGLCRLFNPEV